MILHQTKLSETTRRRIADMIRDGCEYRDIQNRFGVSSKTVGDISKEISEQEEVQDGDAQGAVEQNEAGPAQSLASEIIQLPGMSREDLKEYLDLDVRGLVYCQPLARCHKCRVCLTRAVYCWDCIRAEIVRRFGEKVAAKACVEVLQGKGVGR